MKEYITISRTEKNITEWIIAILTIIALLLCVQGMKLAAEYNELLEEKEALEEIIEVQKGVINNEQI